MEEKVGGEETLQGLQCILEVGTFRVKWELRDTACGHGLGVGAAGRGATCAPWQPLCLVATSVQMRGSRGVKRPANFLLRGGRRLWGEALWSLRTLWALWTGTGTGIEIRTGTEMKQ